MVEIIDTKIEEVTEKHKTPWVKKWTLHTIEISKDKINDFSEKISLLLDSKHNWYADFKNDKYHYIIFYKKVFKIDRRKNEEYLEATKYGINLGIPDYQVDFLEFLVKNFQVVGADFVEYAPNLDVPSKITGFLVTKLISELIIMIENQK